MTDPIQEQFVQVLPRLRAFARSLAPTWDQADDLVQQTVEKGLRNLPDLRPGTRLDSWLFKIMRNSWIDETRRTKRIVALKKVATMQPVYRPDGRRITEAKIDLARVRAAMNDLPHEQRAVLMLVCIEGLKYREVGEILEIPLGTVMSRLARARLALANEFGLGQEDGVPKKGQAR